MEKKINLEEILEKISMKYGYSDFTHCITEQEYTEKEVVKEAMKEAISQALELAAENAKIIYDPDTDEGSLYDFKIVDKQSILDTIKQIE